MSVDRHSDDERLAVERRLSEHLAGRAEPVDEEECDALRQKIRESLQGGTQ